MKKTRILSVILVGVVALSLFGCGAKKEDANKEDKNIKIGVSPVPHKEIVDVAKPLLEKDGYKVEIVEFSDFVQPNTALNDKELDANFFQHIPYLNKSNEEKKLDLTYTAKIHIEPMGFYSKKIKDIKELKDGATISIPNDPTNGARALKLLEKNGILKVKDGELVTAADITENPKHIKIKELEAPQLTLSLDDVDGSVINTNFALQGNLNPTKDALLIESKDSPYANILAVRKGTENSEKIKALTKALTSPEVKKFIEDKYNGSIVPAF
ncbi:D-methionine transport system substrate-binding protein [Clostridium cavendishii DSM 21758]|uniref:Lipoprotein n=1 Tax=Clostridium cavendishii DSM 21758 TaxID=1121302 RepID=A0A1M6BG26_9CLOT|nr:MetQ/NlpA family ABC transporter substrate-binding protein [Clostridium cavendishii]SHI47730.1 D-methionine transport system substrate-binding protein [Clostridium cavendishii DSM 21758]